MKQLLIALGLLGGMVALTATEANAVVCARGVVRAGCVGPGGVVAVRRPVVAPRAAVVVGGPVMAPRRAVVVRRPFVR